MVQESCENMLCHIANSSENMWKEGSIRDDERPRLPLSEASMMDSVSSSFLATRPPGRGPLLPAPPRAVGAPAPPPSSSSRAAAAAVVAAEASDAGVAIYKSSLEKKLRVNFETLNPKDWLGDIIDNTEGNNAGVRETKPNVNYDGMGSMAMEECSDSEAEMKNGEFDEWVSAHLLGLLLLLLGLISNVVFCSTS